MYKQIRYLIAGDMAVIVEFGNEISKQINLIVREMHFSVKKEQIIGIQEMIPIYRSLPIYYNPFGNKLF